MTTEHKCSFPFCRKPFSFWGKSFCKWKWVGRRHPYPRVIAFHAVHSTGWRRQTHFISEMTFHRMKMILRKMKMTFSNPGFILAFPFSFRKWIRTHFGILILGSPTDGTHFIFIVKWLYFHFAIFILRKMTFCRMTMSLQNVSRFISQNGNEFAAPTLFTIGIGIPINSIQLD